MRDVLDVDEIIDHVFELSPRVLIIDGRSGSGKTSLAETLAPKLRANILHMDDLYHGWNGLAEAPKILVQAMTAGTYFRYDWLTESIAEKRILDRHRPLIVEGCGSLTQETIEAAHHFSLRPEGRTEVKSIWIDCPEPERKARALDRDGDTFHPFWDSWAKQEEALLTREQPYLLADIRLWTGEPPSTLG